MTTVDDDAQPDYRERHRIARAHARAVRRAASLRVWIAAQETDQPGPGRWICVYSELSDHPAWFSGPHVGEDVVAAVEALATERYLVRRVERAGSDVRRVEVRVR